MLLFVAHFSLVTKRISSANPLCLLVQSHKEPQWPSGCPSFHFETQWRGFSLWKPTFSGAHGCQEEKWNSTPLRVLLDSTAGRAGPTSPWFWTHESSLVRSSKIFPRRAPGSSLLKELGRSWSWTGAEVRTLRCNWARCVATWPGGFPFVDQAKF